MEGAFRAHTLWAGSTDEELESAGEGLEKYVMTKLYNRAFASFSEDVKRDEELFEKISLIQKFIRPENLDIKPTFQNETSWLLAQKELQKINMYKAPRDKLVCILNCCKVITNLLLNASISSHDNPPGADEFLPVLIYVTIKANPPQLHSNLLYIQRYRRQSRLVSEAAYFFTNILSAESFIWNIDAQSLSMDEAEYQHSLEAARALLLGLSSESESQKNQTNEKSVEHKEETAKSKSDINSSVRAQDLAGRTNDLKKGRAGKDQSLKNSSSVSDLQQCGASDLLKEEHLSKYFLEYPFLFALAGDLTTEDVEKLLNSYKQLVLKYVCLCKGMGVNSSSLSVSTIQMATESTAESRDSAELVTNNEKDEGLNNNPSNEKDEGLNDNQSNEKYGGLTNNQSSDSLFSGLDERELKVAADDSVDNPIGEKNNQLSGSLFSGLDEREEEAPADDSVANPVIDQPSDSLFSGLDGRESRMPADDSIANPTVEKNEVSE
ncbi:vacuolar protein sorting-associated protein 9A-like isoform X2 [Asparagus officinalis]|nr:vacuolar protein sorting-associated protein 9A-like isoform X2 [Asparagus officinalis]